MSENIIIAIITVIGSIVGSGVALTIFLAKLRPEINKTQADARSSNAEASESWAKSNELAASQLVVLQKEIIAQRLVHTSDSVKISELEIRIDILERQVVRLKSQVTSLGIEPVK